MDFQALMVTYQDCSGMLRGRIVPPNSRDTVYGAGLSVGRATGTLLTFDDGIAEVEGIDPFTGDLRLVADSKRTVMLDAERQLAWAPASLLEEDGTPAPACPRSLLQTLVAKAEDEHGLQLLTGVELEFTVLHADSATGTPLAYGHDGPAYGARAIIDLEAFTLDLLAALETADVDIDVIHPEYARGQYEVVLAPQNPVRTADNVVLCKLVIDRTARRHGLRPSFAPLVSEEMAGNGCHTHLSASDADGNVFHEVGTEWGMSARAEHMMAGILESLSEGVALLAGNPTSYVRLTPGRWSGGVICWGVRNREAALRLLPSAGPVDARKANVELKTSDALSNHYLVGAFLAAAALTGLERGSRLPTPVSGDPGLLTDAQRREHCARSFPADLGIAIEAPRSSSTLRAKFGDEMVDVYCAVRSAEWNEHRNESLADQIAATLLRY